MLAQPRSTHRREPLVRDDGQVLTNDIVGLATRFGRYGRRRMTGPAQTCLLRGEPQTCGAYPTAGGAWSTSRVAQERPAVDGRRVVRQAEVGEEKPCVGL